MCRGEVLPNNPPLKIGSGYTPAITKNQYQMAKARFIRLSQDAEGNETGNSVMISVRANEFVKSGTICYGAPEPWAGKNKGDELDIPEGFYFEPIVDIDEATGEAVPRTYSDGKPMLSLAY